MKGKMDIYRLNKNNVDITHCTSVQNENDLFDPLHDLKHFRHSEKVKKIIVA